MLNAEMILDRRTFSQYVSPGDDQSLSRILVMFKHQIDRNLDDLKQALSSRDLGQIDRALHKMKGTTAFIGAEHMRSLTCQAMETPVEQRLPMAHNLLGELEVGLQKTIEAMRSAA